MAGHPKYGRLEVFLVTGEVDEGHHLRGRSADVHPVQRPCTATDDTWKNENQCSKCRVHSTLFCYSRIQTSPKMWWVLCQGQCLQIPQGRHTHEVGMCISHVARRCIQTRQWFMGTEQSHVAQEVYTNKTVVHGN